MREIAVTVAVALTVPCSLLPLVAPRAAVHEVPGPAGGQMPGCGHSSAERHSARDRARHDDLRSELHTYFERFTRFGFSGSVLLAMGDDLVFVNAYGEADRESRRPFLPSTVVPVGSITKPFTAAAILKLQEIGLLDVSDSIAAHLPNVPSDKREITVHHLLTHTSGLKRNGLEGGDFNLKATRDAVLREALSSELLSTPGAEYQYSNLGYSLLAMIIENASRTPYERFLHEHLLAPARMYRTGFSLPVYKDQELAAGYRDDRRLDPVVRKPMLEDGPTWNLRGNGGLHSDAYDLFRWFLALRGRESLSQGSLASMIHPHVSQGDGQPSYGYGWEIGTTSQGTPDISHSGGNGYFAADLHWLPEEDLVYFIGSNDASRVNVRRLSSIVEAIVFGNDYRLPPLLVEVSDEVLRRYEGRYRLEGGDALQVTPIEKGLVLTADGRGAVQAVLGGERTMEDDEVARLADLSARIVLAEFAGDFVPKFEAMGGIVSAEDLERYHSYDRETWDEEFGALTAVGTIAAAGAGADVQTVVLMDFHRGTAAQIHTWRDGRLADVSVIPDWDTFQFSRNLFPVSESRFESFSSSTSLRVTVRFEKRADEAGGSYLLMLPADCGRPY